MTDDFDKWVLRIFGSIEAYEKSLPARLWFQNADGTWGSAQR
jgi:hypothetical protein